MFFDTQVYDMLFDFRRKVEGLRVRMPTMEQRLSFSIYIIYML